MIFLVKFCCFRVCLIIMCVVIFVSGVLVVLEINGIVCVVCGFILIR